MKSSPIVLAVFFCYIISLIPTIDALQAASSSIDQKYEECKKLYGEVDDGTGWTDRCCVRWRTSTCVVNTIGSLLRSSTLEAMKIRMNQAGCDKYATHVGETMPAACYFKYRKWVPITVGILALIVIAAIVAAVVVVIRKRGRHAALRDSERNVRS